MDLIRALTDAQLKSELPEIKTGDTVKVSAKVVEGNRERITVRRIASGVGVERTFKVHSPRIEKIEVIRHGVSNRAQLYYLRDRVGKQSSLRERREGATDTAKVESAGTAKKPAKSGGDAASLTAPSAAPAEGADSAAAAVDADAAAPATEASEKTCDLDATGRSDSRRPRFEAALTRSSRGAGPRDSRLGNRDRHRRRIRSRSRALQSSRRVASCDGPSGRAAGAPARHRPRLLAGRRHRGLGTEVSHRPPCHGLRLGIERRLSGPCPSRGTRCTRCDAAPSAHLRPGCRQDDRTEASLIESTHVRGTV